MLIIGERINTSRKVKGEAVIEKAVLDRDEAAIRRLALAQVEAGADYVDINCGTLSEGEPEALAWLTRTVQGCVDAPLCFDTPNARALEDALVAYEPSKGRPLVNSITAEKARYDRVLPFVLTHKARVIALAMDDAGIQTDPEARLDVARRLIGNLSDSGVPHGDIYVDPMTFPAGAGEDAALSTLRILQAVKAEFPEVNTVAGLSNVSHGMPARRVLNWAMTVLCAGRGLDAAILDPLDRTLMALVAASDALLGRDEYCMNYIARARAGAFEGL